MCCLHVHVHVRIDFRRVSRFVRRQPLARSAEDLDAGAGHRAHPRADQSRECRSSTLLLLLCYSNHNLLTEPRALPPSSDQQGVGRHEGRPHVQGGRDGKVQVHSFRPRARSHKFTEGFTFLAWPICIEMLCVQIVKSCMMTCSRWSSWRRRSRRNCRRSRTTSREWRTSWSCTATSTN